MRPLAELSVYPAGRLATGPVVGKPKVLAKFAMAAAVPTQPPLQKLVGPAIEFSPIRRENEKGVPTVTVATPVLRVLLMVPWLAATPDKIPLALKPPPLVACSMPWPDVPARV